MTQAGCVTVYLGSNTVDVPRRIFKGRSCEIDADEAAKFSELVRARSPWLTENSVKVILEKARLETIRTMDEESNGRSHSSRLADEGRLDEAIAHMRLHLEQDPDDPDSWYALGNLLCRAGDAKEGYRAFDQGSRLAEKKAQHSPRRGR